MPTSYASEIADAQAAVLEYGAQASYFREGASTRVSAGTFTQAADKTATVHVLRKMENKASARNATPERGSSVVMGTRLYIMAAEAWDDASELIPAVGDQITLGSSVGKVIAVDELAPGDQSILWYIRVED